MFPPQCQLVVLVSALLVVFGVPSPVIPGFIFVAAAVVALLSPQVRASRWLLTVLLLAGPMLVIVFLIQGLFYPGEEITVLAEFGPATVTEEGLLVASQLWLRVAAMIAVCAVFALGSDASRVFDGLIALRAPLSLAYVVSSALGLIPLLRHQLTAAMTARAARGWDTSRLRVQLRLLPRVVAGLLTATLAQLDQRHDALAQRGFGVTPRPAPARTYRDDVATRLVLVITPVAAIGLVLLSMLGMVSLPSAREILEALRA